MKYMRFENSIEGILREKHQRNGNHGRSVSEVVRLAKMNINRDDKENHTIQINKQIHTSKGTHDKDTAQWSKHIGQDPTTNRTVSVPITTSKAVTVPITTNNETVVTPTTNIQESNTTGRKETGGLEKLSRLHRMTTARSEGLVRKKSRLLSSIREIPQNMSNISETTTIAKDGSKTEELSNGPTPTSNRPTFTSSRATSMSNRPTSMSNRPTSMSKRPMSMPSNPHTSTSSNELNMPSATVSTLSKAMLVCSQSTPALKPKMPLSELISKLDKSKFTTLQRNSYLTRFSEVQQDLEKTEEEPGILKEFINGLKSTRFEYTHTKNVGQIVESVERVGKFMCLVKFPTHKALLAQIDGRVTLKPSDRVDLGVADSRMWFGGEELDVHYKWKVYKE